MLSREENEVLTRIGPGTPCGELMRRYWQPAALCEELPSGGAPLPIRLLGEDLVLFRDPSTGSGQAGRPGLLGLHCSHRGADLSYGRVEDGGLRCIYHGWLYDIHGRCLEQPGEPTSNSWTYSGGQDSMQSSTLEAHTEARRPFREKIRHLAYPCQEAGGMILTYMGPGEPPLVPPYEFLDAPATHRYTGKILHECNYLQANEGNCDPVHTSFLHRQISPADSTMAYIAQSVAPILDTEETDFGVRIYSVRPLSPEENYVRITNFVLPNLSAFAAGGTDGYTVNWHVPIDDTHHWKYVIQFRRDRPIDLDAVRRERNALTSDYRLTRNRANRYLQDREEMQSATFSGLGTAFQAQDLCVTEGEGPIQDRTTEHLGYTDRGVIAARRALVRAIQEVEAGREAPHVIRDPSCSRVPSLVVRADVLPALVGWRRYWEGSIPSPPVASEGEGVASPRSATNFG